MFLVKWHKVNMKTYQLVETSDNETYFETRRDAQNFVNRLKYANKKEPDIKLSTFIFEFKEK